MQSRMEVAKILLQEPRRTLFWCLISPKLPESSRGGSISFVNKGCHVAGGWALRNIHPRGLSLVSEMLL